MRTSVPLLTALTAMLLVPLAAAEATSQHIVFTGEVEDKSDSFAGMAVVAGAPGGVTDIMIQTDAGHAVAWEQTSVATPTMPTCGVDQRTCFSVFQAVPGTESSERFPASGEWSGGRLTLLEAAARHQINIIPLGEAAIHIRDASAIALETQEDPCLGYDGIEETSQAEPCDGYDDRLPFLSAVPLPSPLRVADTDKRVRATITGDFALEFVNLVLGGPEGEVLNAVTEDAAAASVQEYRFVRIELRGATMHLKADGAAQAVWGTGPASTSVVGDILFSDLTGDLGLGEVQRLDGQTALSGSFLLRSEPSDGGLTLDGEERSLAGPDLASDTSRASVGWWLALLAALVPAAAVYVMVRRRDARFTMQDVEDALQAGQYTHAAWMSTRILRSRPDHESAHLGRGIALTKAGRFKDAVAHLRTYLESNDPQDGTLHYVLGTALKELGEHAQAEWAWGEAAQRTPALGDALSVAPDGAAYT